MNDRARHSTKTVRAKLGAVSAHGPHRGLTKETSKTLGAGLSGLPPWVVITDVTTPARGWS
jgi:hypothetical protein